MNPEYIDKSNMTENTGEREAEGEIPTNGVSFSDSLRALNESARNIADLSRTVVEAAARISAVARSVDFSQIAQSINTIRTLFSDVLKGIHIPEISENRKNALLAANRAWGELGWTRIPDESMGNYFHSMPPEKEEADKKILAQVKNMEPVFDTIQAHKRVNKKDLCEAIFDFKEKKYKSCALILFSLIDAKLIRFQPKNKQRAVGAGAVKKARERFTSNEGMDLLYFTMFCENLFACLEKVFEHGKDFKVQPSVINRNFLDHGMMWKRVTRKDCVQLFLLYYNVLEMLDYTYC